MGASQVVGRRRESGELPLLNLGQIPPQHPNAPPYLEPIAKVCYNQIMRDDAIILSVVMLIVAILGLVGLIFGVIWLLQSFVITRLKRHATQTVQRWEQAGVNIVHGPEGSNFGGLQSMGVARVRGNGIIALTEQDVRVTRLLPAGEWIIPFDSITEVSLQRWFLTHANLRTPYLIIAFNRLGTLDALGVQVRDPRNLGSRIATTVGLELVNKL